MGIHLDGLIAVQHPRVDPCLTRDGGDVRIVKHEAIGPGAFPHEGETVIGVQIARPRLPGTAGGAT